MPINATLTTHTCSSFTNFLDLQCSLVNILSGSVSIFIALISIAYLVVAAYLRLPIGAIGAGIILLGAIISPINTGLFAFTFIIGLIMVGLSIAQAFSR